MRTFWGVSCSVLVVAGCAGAEPEAGDGDDDDSAEQALTASTVYRCSALEDVPAGWDAMIFLRVSKTKATWNDTKSFAKTAGAKTAKRDRDYRPRGRVQYARYEDNWTSGNQFGMREWRVEPEMLSGGKAMRSGERGGFAIYGDRFDTYSTLKYVCFVD